MPNAIQAKCESPIERIIHSELAPLLLPAVVCEMQYRLGRSRVDFYAIREGHSVVIECDGREFHEFKPDRARDIYLIENCGIERVIHLRGSDIIFQTQSCLTFIEQVAPFLFNEQYRIPDAESLYMLSSGMRGRMDKPILRAIVPSDSKVPGDACKTGSFTALKMTSDGSVIIEIRASDWSRDYAGPQNVNLRHVFQADPHELLKWMKDDNSPKRKGSRS